MITKIKTINGFAVFKNFSWDTTVRDKGNNIAEFKKLNIIYGRNYSGKTTLSRIFRSFEKGCKHGKYLAAEFELDHSGNEKLCHEALDKCPYAVRVRIPAQAATRFRFIPPPDSDLSRHPIPIDSATGFRSIPPPPGERIIDAG